MKRCFALLLGAALLLCGCGSPTNGEQLPATPMEPTVPVEQPKIREFAVYEPAHSVEILTGGSVKYYGIEQADYYGMVPMGSGILLFSGEAETTLTYVQVDAQPISVTLTGCNVLPNHPSFRVSDAGVSYYNANSHSLVFLDQDLQETSRISLPDEVPEMPVLSADQQWVYYYINDSLRSLELRSGISRLLKESNYSSQQVHDLCFDSKLLECFVSDGAVEKTLYISTETGKTLFELDTRPNLQTDGQRYFARCKERDEWLLLFGTRGETIRRLSPMDSGVMVPLLQSQLVVTHEEDTTGTDLVCYDLEADDHLSSVRLAGVSAPLGIVAEQDSNRIWFLAEALWTGEQAMYCWDPDLVRQPLEQGFVSPYYTAESPDREGLERCGNQADVLAQGYGIRIEIWQDALKQAPADYTLQPEYLVSSYEKYLPVLEKALNNFPKEIYRRLGKQSQNGKLTISLVREVYGTNELGSQTLEQGVHFWNNGSSYLVLMLNDKLEQSLYHELFHAIDSYILTETKIFDDWRKLNPSGFSYDYSYVTNEYRDPKSYLDPEKRAFIDLYSMSYPKEDRARIMEYAMMPGNEAYFSSQTMHKKLQTISKGINRAFGLSDSQDYLWEQYL